MCAGTLCTLEAECEGGECVTLRWLTCDDANTCTVDSCDEDVGCINQVLPDGAACTDGDLCTWDDVCTDGLCDGVHVICAPAGECEGDGVCNPATGSCDYPYIPGCVICGTDTHPPTMTCPVPVAAAECVYGGAAVELGVASARDECSGVTVTSDAPERYPVGITPVTFTGTDAAGNSATCVTSVTVVDTTPPELTCPALTTAFSDGTCGATVKIAVVATDGCDGEDVTLHGPIGPSTSSARPRS